MSPEAGRRSITRHSANAEGILRRAITFAGSVLYERDICSRESKATCGSRKKASSQDDVAVVNSHYQEEDVGTV